MHKPWLIVHGGAWDIPDDQDEAHRSGVARAVAETYPLLCSGDLSAVEAVEHAVRILDDDSTFDAGVGSFLKEAGEVEMDASIMDGTTLAAGCVAAVQNICHPITAARLVMTETQHVLLVGTGAQAFVKRFPTVVPEVDPMELLTERERLFLEQIRLDQTFHARQVFAGNSEPSSLHTDGDVQRKRGTVGAVALDANGNIAAATSTGGIPRKMVGRVGDSPIIGAGTFADSSPGFGGASATGWGEAILKVGLTKGVVDRMGRASGMTASAAAADSIRELATRAAGVGGVIAIRKPFDSPGAGVSQEEYYGWSFNTPKMAYAYWDIAADAVVASVGVRSERGR